MGIAIGIGFVNLLISSLISYLLGPFINNLGLKLRILDIPDQRKIHKKPIVRIGGLSIVFTFFIYITLTYRFIPYFEVLNLRIIGLLVGSLIYFILGLHDDIYRCPFGFSIISYQIFILTFLSLE